MRERDLGTFPPILTVVVVLMLLLVSLLLLFIMLNTRHTQMRVLRDNGISKGDVQCLACRGVRRISNANDLETHLRLYEKQKEDAQRRAKDLKDRGENQCNIYEDFSTFYNAELELGPVVLVPEGCQIVE